MIVRNATVADIRHVFANLRGPDADEQRALSPFVDMAELGECVVAWHTAGGFIGHLAFAFAANEPAVAVVGARRNLPWLANLYRAATPGWERIASPVAHYLAGEFKNKILVPNVRVALCEVPETPASGREFLEFCGFTARGAALPIGRNGERFIEMAWLNG